MNLKLNGQCRAYGDTHWTNNYFVAGSTPRAVILRLAQLPFQPFLQLAPKLVNLEDLTPPPKEPHA